MAELIVNQTNFSEVFKDTIGFVDADFSWRRVKPAVKMSTEELIDLIGETNYKAVLAMDKNLDFYDLVRFVILMKALIIYLPTGDLAISNNGRTMRRDDKTVSAFQWQIEKHDESLERMYYRGLDSLLKHMFKNDMKLEQGKYDYKNLIVNSLALFENHFDIGNSNLLFFKLIPALREAELLEILPRLDKASLENEKSLEFLVQKIIVNYAMAWGINKLNLQLFPKGILQNEMQSNGGSSKKKSEASERQGLALRFEKDVARDLIKLEKEVSKKDVVKDIEDVFNFGFDNNDGFVDV